MVDCLPTYAPGSDLRTVWHGCPVPRRPKSGVTDQAYRLSLARRGAYRVVYRIDDVRGSYTWCIDHRAGVTVNRVIAVPTKTRKFSMKRW